MTNNEISWVSLWVPTSRGVKVNGNCPPSPPLLAHLKILDLLVSLRNPFTNRDKLPQANMTMAISRLAGFLSLRQVVALTIVHMSCQLAR